MRVVKDIAGFEGALLCLFFFFFLKVVEFDDFDLYMNWILLDYEDN